MAKKTRPLLIAAVGCLIGGGISFIFFGNAGANDTLREVPVAKIRMPPGYVIQKQDIEMKKETVGEWYKVPEKLEGSVVDTGIPAGIPVSQEFIRHKAYRQDTVNLRVPVDIYEMSSKLGKVDLYVLYKDGRTELLSEGAQVTKYYNRQNQDIAGSEVRDRNPAAAEIIIRTADLQKVKSAQNKGKFYFTWKGDNS